MMGHNISFKRVIWKIIPKLSLLPLLIWSTVICMITMISTLSFCLNVFIFKSCIYQWYVLLFIKIVDRNI